MNYVGIDLGTTNSAICSYDGTSIKLYKSAEQHDVTPSAIFFDRRGNKYVGSRAYNNAARYPDNSAKLFKRLMGTSTPIKLPAVNLTMTPEECSAEVLRTLFGYLPEEFREEGEIGTVITVPAAFNQMQKDSTMAAAEMAGIGNVALMQEPVAAVMSVMRHNREDGIFLIYDIGGGTLDIALAQSVGGRVNLLSHGGIAMCGGRDFDRILFDNVVRPWLQDRFKLPDDMSSKPQFRPLLHMAMWATEKAKIELSQREEASISLPEAELGIKDEQGEEVYIDLTINRDQFDSLIATKVDESIRATREAIEKANLSPHDIGRIVFVGGPVHYKPLRDKVAFELGVSASTEVNPMTAVAEGAAVFAESIDWSTSTRARKTSRGAIRTGGSLNLSFNYVSRTPESRAKIVAKVDQQVPAGAEFQVDSLDTGWSSGRVKLKDGASLELALPKPGDNQFKVFVFDTNGSLLRLQSDRIIITRTAASIDAIPASHSVGVETLERLGGSAKLSLLVKEGDQLPTKGKVVFRAGESLKAGSTSSLKFKLWEGDIEDPVHANRFIGMFEIKGTDFEDSVIAAGSELICEYEVLDSGCLVLEVEVPSIGNSFHPARNFYSSREGKVDYTRQARNIQEQAEQTLERVDELASKVSDERLDEVRERLKRAKSIRNHEADPEVAKKAMDDVQEAKKLLSQTKKDFSREIRQLDLDRIVDLFNRAIREMARPSEVETFDNLVRSAKRSIEENRSDFEFLVDEMRGRITAILWRQDGFVIDRFRWLSEETHLFPDQQEHARLVSEGSRLLRANDIDKLRFIVAQLDSVRIGSVREDDLMARANIVLS